MIDAELRRGPGGQPGNSNALKQEPETIVDNVHNRYSEARPTGNAIDAGLRRLRKAAESGDSRAVLWLDDVLAGRASVNKACIAMDWRKPTVTLFGGSEMKPRWRIESLAPKVARLIDKRGSRENADTGLRPATFH